jgi:hypothetical protein
VIYEWQFQDWWIRPKLSYQISDKTYAALGFDIFAGGFQTPYGQYTNASNVFVQLHRVLF